MILKKLKNWVALKKIAILQLKKFNHAKNFE